MARAAQVSLRGRFSPGTRVRLVRVASEATLRAEGGEDVASATVDGDGLVQFRQGVRVGDRYMVVGLVDGVPVEVRARGNALSDESAVLSQAPVQPDRLRLSDGSFVDEEPTKESAPRREAAPAPSQQQVPDGVVQRSDTPRGYAHPLDPSEPAPYESQENVEGVLQMSDTPHGRATRIVDAPVRQEDVPSGVWQRSDTETGVATPISKGDAVRAQMEKESSFAKESRGEPVRAAAEPLERSRTAASRLPGDDSPEDEDEPGVDAQGQAADADAPENQKK